MYIHAWCIIYIAGEVTKCNYIVEFLRHCSRYIDDLFIPNGTKQIADIYSLQ